MTAADPLLGFTESETEHGPVLHFPPLNDERGGEIGEDMLALAADLADSTSCPVDVFLADVGVRAHDDPDTPRLSVVLRVDHEPAPAWTPGVQWRGAIARGRLTSPWPTPGVVQYCPHMNGHRKDSTALACAVRGARRGGWR
jgi:hypothetical protein